MDAVNKMTRYCRHPSPNWLRAMMIKLYKQITEIRVHTEKKLPKSSAAGERLQPNNSDVVC
jgi:hypothetical protein